MNFQQDCEMVHWVLTMCDAGHYVKKEKDRFIVAMGKKYQNKKLNKGDIGILEYMELEYADHLNN